MNSNAQPGNDEVEQEWLWEKREKLLLRAELSTVYHRKLERALSRSDRLIKLLSLIGGSAAITRVATTDLIIAIGLMIAIANALGLVMAFADRSRKHAELACSFKKLEREIVAAGERDFTERDVNQWEAELREIEIGEPPELSALIRICQNEQALARGDLKHVYRIPLYQRVFAFWFDFPARKLKPAFPEAE
jgi:hypothetical protein